MLFVTYLFAIVKSVIYGLSVFFTGGLLENLDVLDVLALRFLLSFVVFWFLKTTKIIKINVGIKDFIKKEKRQQGITSILLAALFEPVLYMFFETVGISMSSGITTGVILSLGPISSCIVEEIVLKEKSTWLQKVFLGVGIIGVIYISVNTATSGTNDSLPGIICLVMAVLSGSLFAAFSRKSSRTFSSMETTYIAAMLGMIVFNAINVIRHIFEGDILSYFAPYFNLENMVGFIYLSVISTIVATGMGNFALARMQLSTMAAFGGISTLTTIAAGILLWGEKLETFHIIGLVLIITRMVGVSYISIKRDKKVL